MDLSVPDWTDPSASGVGAAGDASPVRVRFKLLPLHRAVLSSGIAGVIAEMPVRPGESFAAGATLLRLDCREMEARLDRTAASVQSARAKLNSDRQLSRLGGGGRLNVQLSQGQLAEATAEQALAVLAVEQCIVKAPFAGAVVSWQANPHESVPEREPLLEIVSDDRLVVEMFLPGAVLAWLKPGSRFEATLRTGAADRDPLSGAVERIGAEIDPASGLIQVFGVLTTPGTRLVPGMVGEAVFREE